MSAVHAERARLDIVWRGVRSPPGEAGGSCGDANLDDEWQGCKGRHHHNENGQNRAAARHAHPSPPEQRCIAAALGISGRKNGA